MRKVIIRGLVLAVLVSLVFGVVGCGSLTMTVTAPEDGSVVDNPQIYVKGKVSNGKATVTVNGKNVWKNIKTGDFQGGLTLEEGENNVTVIAKHGKTEVTRVMKVTYQPELAMAQP